MSDKYSKLSERTKALLRLQHKRSEIEKTFLEENPTFENETFNWRLDGRLEWICKHGIGHTVYAKKDEYVHGCDGCCEKVNIPDY